jgi:hypothetical protein
VPIYEYYCPDNHRIYQFYAKTLAQGGTVPRCPDGVGLKMEKLFSPFAVTGRAAKKAEGRGGEGPLPAGGAEPGGPDDARMESAMAAMEGEMAGLDENDPKAMGRMMRRMADLTGEKIEGEMEEVVRKLEEGADPESLEEQMGSGEEAGPDEGGGPPPPGAGAPEGRPRVRVRRGPPLRDPKLYDY